ncbi:hypothetical protein [Massilia horti]|uniref:Uncharacterized protein n=1 Tax=Massilia horti TaxID=2562153 RepID=A0A4Y9STJ6_9BURK|nr:hypothetical protein [Massilia horti]TFW28659.1 hypothetical protein E4O92_20630 [Massilia horti]
MSMIEVKAMTAPETAAFLRQQLGPIVAWDDWLSDRRRGRGDPLADFDLQPCASLKSRCRRPVYAIKDIVEFIRSVRRRHPTAQPGIKPSVLTIKLDSEDCRSWRMRPPTPACAAA